MLEIAQQKGANKYSKPYMHICIYAYGSVSPGREFALFNIYFFFNFWKLAATKPSELALISQVKISACYITGEKSFFFFK